jgi:ABC-type branched-subunit amino acid transport system ATPase component
VTAPARPALLSVEDVSFAYDALPVLRNVSLTVDEGSVVGLIGPNGAGKSTLIECVSGAIRGYSGTIRFAGHDVTRWPTYRRASIGLVRTFQVSRVFSSLTSMSNVLVAMKGQKGERLTGAVALRWRPSQQPYVGRAAATLNHYGLTAVANDAADSLSGGQRRLLEIARALSLRPRLLILDEPFAGVSPVMRERIREQLLELRRAAHLSVLMIEHRLDLVEEICSDIVVLANGRPIARGTMDALRRNSAVLDAYLGVA